jgi:hypothetical protein
MNWPVLMSVGLAIALSSAGGCSRPPAPQHEAAAPVAAPPPPPLAPAKKAVMICRNSVDGRSVKCGTPNAVMVGIKSE